VRSRLAPQERVDTPPPVERRLDPARLKDGQELEHAFGGHSSSLAAQLRRRVNHPSTARTPGVRPTPGPPAAGQGRRNTTDRSRQLQPLL
jgi:hypothetical protein